MATTPFATPAVGGFNKRGAHPEGGDFYGVGETALCQLIRGGALVIREHEWHDDETGNTERAPVHITHLYGILAALC
eukprot:CAMPEP_0174699204 /NCGR_PEP_ID=MMETSP1094-20130205/4559_1 /TAXON_ID=156173 /ORGANISM="Chrysochromulina brevifilum, Strain UTEX LB 985" /LENGTH=76 /DNA_ID=CAMNT_0015896489 /DNA_START=99 /DNA_END=329 /DNA_ORIENTATION=-